MAALAFQTARRKEIYEELNPETKAEAFHGNWHTGSRRQFGDGQTSRFTASTAAATGRHARTVEHGAKLLAALGIPETVDSDLVPFDHDFADNVLKEVIDLLDALDAPAEDREEDDPVELDDPAEDVGDHEPSLGSLGGTAATCHLAQTCWSDGGRQDFEEQDEDGEDINDEPHDEDPHEPSLGSLDRRIDQRKWAGDSSIASWTDAELDDSDAENCCRTWPRTEAEVASHTFHPVARRAHIVDLPRPGDFGQGEARRLDIDAPRRWRGYDRTYTQCGVRVVGSVR